MIVFQRFVPIHEHCLYNFLFAKLTIPVTPTILMLLVISAGLFSLFLCPSEQVDFPGLSALPAKCHVSVLSAPEEP